MKLTERIKKNYKRWLKHSIILLAFHQTLPYPISSIKIIMYKSKIKINLSEEIKKKKLPLDFSSLDYLAFSNAIVHLEANKGDCKDYSISTYDTYKKLIRLNKRNYLEKKVRLVGGQIMYENQPWGHAWLEIKKDGMWCQYETTAPQYNTDEEYIKRYSRNNLYGVEVYSRNFVTYPGTYIPLPTLDILDPSKGTIPLCIDMIKQRFISHR